MEISVARTVRPSSDGRPRLTGIVSHNADLSVLALGARV